MIWLKYQVYVFKHFHTKILSQTGSWQAEPSAYVYFYVDTGLEY